MMALVLVVLALLCDEAVGRNHPGPNPVARLKRRPAPESQGTVMRVHKRPPFKASRSVLRVHNPRSVRQRGKPSGTRVLPLLGSLDVTASFYLPMLLGTPGQKVNLLIDTGSTDLVVMGGSCQGCPAAAQRYFLGKSKTGSDQTCDSMNYACTNQCQYQSTCQFEDDYGGGGSIQGNVVQDTVSFPGSPAWNVTYVYFGQIESDNVPGDFVIPPEDGIMGFAFQALSAWQQPCVFSHMGVYQSFSTCLTVSPPPVFEMGTNYRGTQRAAFNWTTMYSDPGWLSVWLSDTGMAGQTLGISASSLNSQSVIVDTGTTFIICSTEMMKIYTARLQAMCAQGVNLVGVCNQTATSSILNGNCFNMTSQDVARYPSLYFTLWNNDDHDHPFTLTIGPSAILQEVCGGPGQGYAFGVQAMDSTPIILGDVLIQNYHVVFDKHDSVIGFRPLSGCPTAP